jgi:hypothetical protein
LIKSQIRQFFRRTTLRTAADAERLSVIKEKIMVKICPRCGLPNPESNQKCDCGFDFESHKLEKQNVIPGDNPTGSESGWTPHQEGKRNMRTGLIVFFVGIIASILVSVFFRGVVILIFMSGPVIYGIIQFFKGLGQSRRHRTD